MNNDGITFTPTAPPMGATPVASMANDGINFTPTTGSAPANGPTPPGTPASGQIFPTPFPATGNETPVTAGLKALGNTPTSLGNFAVGLAKAPITGLQDLQKIPEAAKGLYDTYSTLPGGFAGGILQTLGSVPGTLYNQFVPQAVKSLVSGDIAGATKSATEDPFGTIAPLVLAGRGIAESSGYGAQFDTAIDNAIKIAKPVTDAVGTTAGAVGGFPATAIRAGVTHATGLDPETITQIVSNPAEFSKDAMAATDRPSVAAVIKDALDARVSALTETGKTYAPIRAAGTEITVDPNWLVDTIRETTGLDAESAKATGKGMPVINFGTELGGTRLVSGPDAQIRNPGEVTKLQQIVDRYQPLFDEGKMTSNQFLNLRSDLAEMAKYEGGIGKSKPLENVSSIIRGKLNTAYRDQIPKLAESDADMSSQATELKGLRKGILDKEGNLTDAGINKIANGSNKTRSVFNQQLEDISPGITARIQILKAIEDIQKATGHKVGTYVRASIGPAGVLGGIVTANLPLIAAAIAEMVLTAPAVVVPLLRAYGMGADLVGAVTGILGKMASQANTLPDAMTGGTPSPLSKFLTTPREASLGLSLKDVTRDNPIYEEAQKHTNLQQMLPKGIDPADISRSYQFGSTMKGVEGAKDIDVALFVKEDHPSFTKNEIYNKKVGKIEFHVLPDNELGQSVFDAMMDHKDEYGTGKGIAKELDLKSLPFGRSIIPKSTQSGSLDLVTQTKGMKLNDAESAYKQLEQSGSAIIAEGKGARLVVKDEGDFVKLGLDTGDLTSTDVALPSKNFATKEDAFAALRPLYERASKVPIEKGGRNLMEWENGDLSVLELQKKLEIAEEGHEDPDLIKLIKRDIVARTTKVPVLKSSRAQ